jgi:hypothetical protein
MGAFIRTGNFQNNSTSLSNNTGSSIFGSRNEYTVLAWSNVASLGYNEGLSRAHIFCTTIWDNFGAGDYISWTTADNKMVISRHGNYSLTPDAKGSTTLEFNTWFMWGLRYDGDILTGFYNGQLEVSLTSSLSVSGEYIHVGTGSNGTTQAIRMSISDARVFNYALTDTQMLAIYDAEK